MSRIQHSDLFLQFGTDSNKTTVTF